MGCWHEDVDGLRATVRCGGDERCLVIGFETVGDMDVLIVESSPELARIWRRHLERQGMCVHVAAGQEDAVSHLHTHAPDMIVLDLLLGEGSAFAVADYANYRHPEARVIFTTNSSFFTDGSIFQHSANACAFLPKQVDPNDLTAMVAHYGQT